MPDEAFADPFWQLSARTGEKAAGALPPEIHGIARSPYRSFYYGIHCMSIKYLQRIRRHFSVFREITQKSR
jgi:hypothetical protein